MKGQFSILVIDSFGHTLADSKATLSRDNRTIPWKVGEHVNYGRYELTVVSSGFETFHRTIKVDKPFQKIIACLRLRPNDLPYPRVSVTFEVPKEDDTCRWGILRPVFSVADAPEAYGILNGLMVVRNVEPGTYYAAAVGSKGVCASTIVTVTATEDQRYRLFRVSPTK